MMILNNLIAEDEAAAKLAEKWTGERNNEQIQVHFVRSSSNYVYALKNREEVYFLRFNRAEERSKEYLQGEIDYLLYLKENGYPAAYPVPSLEGTYVEEICHKGEIFYGSLFERARGIQLEDEELEQKHLRAWGRALAQLHKLSEKYIPRQHVRPSFEDQIEHMKDTFKKYNEEGALSRVSKVETFLADHQKNKENYGLIHYDFEDDNFVYDEKKDRVVVYDFDDAVYHFYAMDIAASIDSLLRSNSIEEKATEINIFLEGYKEIRTVEADIIKMLPEFNVYAKLYQFSRLLRALDCPVLDKDVPEWLPRLRRYLEGRMEKSREFFMEG